MDKQESSEGKLSRFWRRLKERYNISSDWHAIFVLFIFAIAGSTIVYVTKPIEKWVGVDQIQNPLVYWPVRIMIILPFYYVSLFLWSNILGQGRIFNPLIKKMLLGWLRPFRKRKK